MLRVNIQRLRASATLPSQMSEGASGYDLYADIETPIEVNPSQRVLVSTGLSLELPRSYEAQIRPRSGLAWKAGMTLINPPGTIDSDYRGEIKVAMINLSDQPYIIHPDDRIAQMVICPVVQVQFVETTLQETTRGDGGFGSTGKGLNA